MNLVTMVATLYIKISAPFGRRGLYRFMMLVNRLLPRQAEREHTVKMDDKSRFTFPAGDPYWLSVFVLNMRYEPEIEYLLDQLSLVPSLFIDCGANFGYWSVRNSEIMRTVAVEASTETYRWLALNNEKNGGRFTALHAAVTDGEAPFVPFSTSGGHAGRSITCADESTEKIVAVSIDELVAKFAFDDGLILVKLDVEGVEIEAFRGATETLRRKAIFVYEDHGKDHSCATTAYLLSTGRRIVFISDDGIVTEIASLEDAKRVKVSKSKGYNFFAFGDAARNVGI